MSLSGFKTPQPPSDIRRNLQWERFSIPAGQSLIGHMPPKGFPIFNVQIDNASGNWLQVNPGGFLIAPLTLGWATNLIPSAASVDIIQAAGPAGSIGNNPLLGGIVNVALYSEPLGNESGTQYSSPTTSEFPSHTFTSALTNQPNGSGIAPWGNPQIPAADTAQLDVCILRFDIQASIRGTVAGSVGNLDIYMVDNVPANKWYLARLLIQPGETATKTIVFSRPYNLQHLLNTNFAWNFQMDYGVQAGTPGNVDCVFVMDWTHST